MNNSMIRQIKKITNPMKYIGVILLLGMFLYNPTFAQQTSSDLANFQEWLAVGVKFLSRGWILLANLAGKLMTNDFVYGSAIHLDIYLWKIWNIMKNFANYVLGFMFLYYIIRSFFSTKDDESPGNMLKNKMPRFLVAGVLIQASWFLLGAVLDLSTIAVGAVGSMPAQFIKSDTALQTTITKAGNEHTRKETIININATKAEDMLKKGTNEGVNTGTSFLVDEAIPDYDNMSGPLIFLGMTVFRFYDIHNIADDENATSIGSMITKFGLNAMILIMYSVAMIIFVLSNLLRILFLRIAIILSPFFILAKVFQSEKILENILPDGLNIQNIISMIFKPVVFAGGLSVILVVTMSMRQVMKGGSSVNIEETQSKIDNTANELQIQQNSFQIEGGSIFNDSTASTAKETFADLIMFFVTLFLLRALVKMTIKNSPGEKFFGNMLKSAENWMMSRPIIPLGGGSKVGVNAVSNIATNTRNNINEKTQFDEAGSNRLREVLGLQGRERNNSDTRKLKNESIAGGKFIEASKDIASKVTDGINIENKEWNEHFMNWVNNNKDNENKHPLLTGRTRNLTDSNWKEFWNDNVDGKTRFKIFHDQMTSGDGVEASREAARYDSGHKVVFSPADK